MEADGQGDEQQVAKDVKRQRIDAEDVEEVGDSVLVLVLVYHPCEQCQ